MKHLLLSSTILFAASTGLMAGEVGVGDPQAGFAYAKKVCANCHAIVSNESPVPEAPAFDEIANRMSAKALLVWMQSRHPTMPNITLEREDLIDVRASPGPSAWKPLKPPSRAAVASNTSASSSWQLRVALAGCSENTRQDYAVCIVVW